MVDCGDLSLRDTRKRIFSDGANITAFAALSTLSTDQKFEPRGKTLERHEPLDARPSPLSTAQRSLSEARRLSGWAVQN